MDYKQIAVTVLIVMLGIWALKWINRQYPIPVLGRVVEEV